jgi:hypothetical protein
LHHGWEENWRVLAPAAERSFELPRGGVRGVARAIGDLPPGTEVVVRAPGFGARGRVRRCARRAGIVVRRECLAFPAVAAPAFLVEDSSSSVGYFFDTVAAVPPGIATLEPVANAGLTVLRNMCRSRLLRSFLPGRILVGARP